MHKYKGFLVPEQQHTAALALSQAERLFPIRPASGIRTGVDVRNREQGIAHATLLIVYETGLRPSNARALALSVLQKPWFSA